MKMLESVQQAVRDAPDLGKKDGDSARAVVALRVALALAHAVGLSDSNVVVVKQCLEDMDKASRKVAAANLNNQVQVSGEKAAGHDELQREEITACLAELEH